jgi:multiple sugar transport system permease protein
MRFGFAGATPPPARRSRSARTHLGWRRGVRRAATGWTFAGPATFIVVGLSIFPAVWAFIISRTKWNGIAPPKGVGWGNYQLMTQDPELSTAVRHTVLLTVLFVPSSVLLGLLIAVALNRKIRLVGFYRTCIFVPYVASAAATGILATFVFNPQFGIANDTLRRLHLPTQQFLESHSQALTVICLIALWGEVGFTAVIYLAALQDIPTELLEAGAIDGAGRLRVFWHIVLPELRAVTVFTTVWQSITALQLFDLIYTTTRGGPLQSTETVVYYMYELAFQTQRFGYGSAVAYGLFAVTVLLTLGIFWYSRRAKVEAF